MSKPCKTERAVQQQKLITEALVTLMGQEDYPGITVSDLCRRASIPRRTFYYYYESKDDVLSGLLGEILNECDLETMFSRQEDRRSLEEGFVRFFCYWRDRRGRALDALLRNDLGQQLINRAIQRISTDLKWQELILHNSEHRAVIGTVLGMSCVYYTLFYWQELGYAQSPQEMAAHVTELLTKPMYRLG